ncbi:MAG: hypothetical protein Tsb0026_04450 [Sulfuricaulis sp.]
MRKEQATDAGFPGIAFAILPKTGETVAIRYGERIYYRVDSAKTADELNAMYGVTPHQAQAVLASALAGWKTHTAN